MWDITRTEVQPGSRTNGRLAVSFEFFPPKTAEAAESFGHTIARLATLGPEFVSVTCGANGSNRDCTFDTVRRIVSETGVRAAAHMTCVGVSRQETEELARNYWAVGIRHIVAVRGDSPTGGGFEKHPEGFANAAELVAGLRRIGDFEISVAAYPEVHPEAVSMDADLENLKRKVDLGATRALSQFFFDTDAFLRFVDRARTIGICVPIVPGILPLTNYSLAAKFAQRCGATIPGRLAQMFEGLDDDPETRRMVAAAVAVEQCRILQDAGIHEFHFYTLNRPELSYAVCHMLGLRPRPMAA